jgi:hypothetical protein
MTSRLPASVFTILRTASHLEAFDFNDATTPPPAAAGAGAAARGGVEPPVGVSVAAEGATAASPGAPVRTAAPNGYAAVPEACREPGGGSRQGRWCSICWAPCPQDNSKTEAAAAAGTVAGGPRLCYSCERQILGSFEAPDGADGVVGVGADDGLPVEAGVRALKAMQLEGLLPKDGSG